jgi:chemotaxis receptor (MCP) glutamine deamidase CheD
MADQTPHQRYVELLMERVRNDTYPSGSDLDRIERSMTTGNEVVAYLQYLLEKVGEENHPSSQMMDRVERLLAQIPAR